MSDAQPPPVLLVRVGEARAWAGWIRQLRAQIAKRKDAGDIDPALAAPQPVYEALLELLAAVDALPDDTDEAELVLPDRDRLGVFVEHLARLRPVFARWVEHWLLDVEPPEAARRFEQQLIRRGRQEG